MAAAVAAGRTVAMARQVLSGDDVAALFGHLAGLEREVVGIGYLDRDGHLLAVRHSLTASSATASAVPLRACAGDVLRLGAARVVMAHNHPSGDPAPSRADRSLTRRLAIVFDALGAPLVEHLVLARGGYFSFAAAGLI